MTAIAPQHLRLAAPALLAVLLAPSLPAQQEQAAAQRSNPRRLVERAVEAMGGAQALRDLRTTVIEFTSTNFGLGQEETPQSPPRATLGYGKITTDWQASRRLAEQETRPVTGVIQRTRQVIVDGIGMNDLNGTLTATQPQGVANVLTGMRLQPHRFLLTALEKEAGLRGLTPATFRGERMDGLRYAIGPDTMNLWFDRPTGLVVVSEIVTDDPILGDRRTLTWYTRWQGRPVKLPWQVDTEVNGRLLSHNNVTSLRENESVDAALFAIPDSIKSRATPAPATPPPPPTITVTLVELAPGVWRAEGGTHHSLVVDQGNRLLVVEAPQNARRMNAVLDTLRARFPNKPVGQVVNTHHHWDHAGGLRAALARGIPVVTHARNAAFVRGIASARKTVAPDALSRRGGDPRITLVTDLLTVGTGDSRVGLVTIPSVHAEGILAAYVPSARILFVSDVLSPGPTLSPVGSAEVVALARARGLTIERVAGGHGGVANWADVEQAAGR
jgi:glyoxylase-like metal-dependent hydrolase (beta-lactamase superfamily II)